MLVFCVILACVVFLCFRIAYIGFKNGDRYKKRVLEQQSFVSSEIVSERGSIVDRNGLILAKSKRVYNVILDPDVVLTKRNSKTPYLDPTVKAIYEVFGIEEETTRKIISEHSSSKYYVLQKQVELSQVEKFEQMAKDNKSIKGVWFEDDFIRVYPYDSLASHVVGFLSGSDEGLWGLEIYYNSTLTGTNGRTYGYFDSELNLQKTVHEAVDGNTLVLTLDTKLQAVAERYINDFVNEVGCKNMGIVMLNPNNGEILAMASKDEYNLNNPRDLTAFYDEETLASMSDTEKVDALNRIWRNFCVSDTYEPGSVFKPFTVAAALEEDTVEPTDEFECNGVRTVGGWNIYCATSGGHGKVSLTKALMRSCNCTLMDIVAELGNTAFHKYQLRFGFGSKTNVDLPGETTGIIMNENQLKATELATSSFGQSFNVSMIQMISAFASLVNGGSYYKPHIVSEIQDSNGLTVQKIEPEVVQETISEETSAFLREAMLQTVEGGTGKKAAVEGYLIGGKTGTAQKLPRSEKRYVVSFMSVVPVDNPQFLMYLVIDDNQDEEYSASSHYATTLSSKILNEVLPMIGIYPEGEIDYHIHYPEEYDDTSDEENGLSVSEVPEN